MKFATLSALVAVASAQASGATAGEDCATQKFICQNTGTICVTYADSTATTVSTCQDCLTEQRMVIDSMGEAVPFVCPDDEEEGASSMYASAAALLAVVTLMA